ncbi:hypothetical protein FGL95_15480 [Nocardiaceae bacterium YC2-7]|uniref:Uncharacterized protein n=1 Tax=Antrihabitans stalactiti TaxID=2584121 RepID=A0A848KID1_9NOCA|nr:hypothetical protein [Antrihabitans stalactiti]
MRSRGVSHVEFADYYMTRFINAHSYIGIQPARSGQKLAHTEQATGINHVALWARNRREVDQFRYRAMREHAGSRPDLARTVPGLMWQARRTLPSRNRA